MVWSKEPQGPFSDPVMVYNGSDRAVPVHPDTKRDPTNVTAGATGDTNLAAVIRDDGSLVGIWRGSRYPDASQWQYVVRLPCSPLCCWPLVAACARPSTWPRSTPAARPLACLAQRRRPPLCLERRVARPAWQPGKRFIVITTSRSASHALSLTLQVNSPFKTKQSHVQVRRDGPRLEGPGHVRHRDHATMMHHHHLYAVRPSCRVCPRCGGGLGARDRARAYTMPRSMHMLCTCRLLTRVLLGWTAVCRLGRANAVLWCMTAHVYAWCGCEGTGTIGARRRQRPTSSQAWQTGRRTTAAWKTPRCGPAPTASSTQSSTTTGRGPTRRPPTARRGTGASAESLRAPWHRAAVWGVGCGGARCGGAGAGAGYVRVSRGACAPSTLETRARYL